VSVRRRAAWALPAALLLAASAASAAVTGRGVEFWAAWPRTHASLEASAQLIVMAAEPTNIEVSGAFSAVGVADEGAPLVIRIPNILRTSVERSPVDVGFRIRSADGLTPISVLFRVPEQAEASDDIARLLPVAELGTRYVVTAYAAAIPVAPSYYMVIATQDATTVTTITRCGGDAGPVVLDAGQIYQVFCRDTDTPPDVTGSVVVADKPVSVLAGASDAWVPVNYLSGDFLVEAMTPVERWGTEFYLAPLPKGPAATNPFDVVRVTASGPLEVTVDDGAVPQTYPLAGEGESEEISITAPVRITATAPIDIQHYATGFEASDFGDPFQATVLDTGSYTVYTRAYLPPDYSQGSFVDIFAPTTSTAGVRFAGQPLGGWAPLPGGTHSWTRMGVGFFSGTRLITAPETAGVLVHGYNDFYVPDPDLGRVPGSYGYPAADALPVCRVEAVGGPAEGCPGELLTLDDAGSRILGCINVEYRWLEDGVPIPGCGFSPISSCTIIYTGPSQYVFEARCIDNPTDCAPGIHLLQVNDAPPTQLQLLPDPAQICEGQMLEIQAPPGYQRYEWTSVPDDPGVTPQVTAVPGLWADPMVDTVYSVKATGGPECLGLDDLEVRVLPDPIPPPIGSSLRVAKDGPGRLVLKWTDLAADPVGGYEAVAHACAMREACPEPPSPDVMEALPRLGLPVGPGVGILSIWAPVGQAVYLKVRALSPCTGSPGSLCDGFPAQVPCP